MSKTSTGLDKNVASGLCYVLGWLSGLIFLLVEKEDKEVRFHAMQSIVVFGGINLLHVVLVTSLLGVPLIPILGIVMLALWVLLMIKGFQGEQYKLPFFGDLAEKWVGQVKL
jgi:uncharacterized membrane protein